MSVQSLNNATLQLSKLVFSDNTSQTTAASDTALLPLNNTWTGLNTFDNGLNIIGNVQVEGNLEINNVNAIQQLNFKTTVTGNTDITFPLPFIVVCEAATTVNLPNSISVANNGEVINITNKTAAGNVVILSPSANIYTTTMTAVDTYNVAAGNSTKLYFNNDAYFVF